MDGGHGAVDNAEGFMDHLHHGSQAVGGAGSRRQQPVPRGVNLLVVAPVDYVEHLLPLHRAGHNHPFHPALLDVGRQRGHRLERPLHSSTISPPSARQSTAVKSSLWEQLICCPPTCRASPSTATPSRQRPWTESNPANAPWRQPGHLHAGPPPEGAEHQPPDAAKAVDANLHQSRPVDGGSVGRQR